MIPPLVSIIVPAHRASRYLRIALESVRAQAWPHWELLVCEDGALDDTADQVNAFAATITQRVRLLRHPHARGVSFARNALLDAATGEYTAFLDADDRWTPDHLAYSLERLKSAHADWIIGGLNLIDPDGRVLAANILPPAMPAAKIPTRLLRHNFILTSSLVARSEVFSRGLRFDRSLAIGEDLDLCIELVRLGFTPTFSRRATLDYRKHAASTTANPVRFAEEFARVFEKHLDGAVVDRRACLDGMRDLLTNAARMTWRREPARAVAALDRLARAGALPLRSRLYLLLARLSRQRFRVSQPTVAAREDPIR